MAELAFSVLFGVCGLALIYAYIIAMNSDKDHQNFVYFAQEIIYSAALEAADKVTLCEVAYYEPNDEGVDLMFRMYVSPMGYQVYNVTIPIEPILDGRWEVTTPENIIYKFLRDKRSDAKIEYNNSIMTIPAVKTEHAKSC